MCAWTDSAKNQATFVQALALPRDSQAQIANSQMADGKGQSANGEMPTGETLWGLLLSSRLLKADGFTSASSVRPDALESFGRSV